MIKINCMISNEDCIKITDQMTKFRFEMDSEDNVVYLDKKQLKELIKKLEEMAGK